MQKVESKNNIVSDLHMVSSSDTWPFETNDGHRRVFLSYSWDSDIHKEWVFKLCQDLRAKGVDAVIDQAMRKGNDLIDFMEKGIANAHRVLVIGTPNYKKKSEENKGGVKYEQNIIKASILQGLGSDRYITILRDGSDFKVSFPAIISTKGGYDMRNDEAYKEHLIAMVHEIYDNPIVKLNPIGPIPEFAEQKGKQFVEENANDKYLTLVKRYLTSSEYKIAFSDLIAKMTDEAFQKIMERADYNIPLSSDNFKSYSRWHGDAVSDLIDAVIQTAQWGNAKQVVTFGNVLSKLCDKPFVSGQVEVAGSCFLHGIGAQFLFNAVGMACVRYERFSELNNILSLTIPSPHFKSYNRRQSMLEVLGEQYWDNEYFNQLLDQNYYYPWTMWIKENVNPHFKSVFTDDSDVEATYYIWEQLKSLCFGYITQERYGYDYCLTGNFLRYRAMLSRDIGDDGPYITFFKSAELMKDEWPPVKQGLFDGDYNHYQAVLERAEKFYKGVVRI